MPDWLNGALPEGEVSVWVLMGRLGASAAFGALVAAVYFYTQRKHRAEAAPLVATLVLLTVLMSMVTQVIGNNAARAFGLVGALSIVRFRTVVDDTRDTAFVIFAVVVGMAVGAGYMTVALAGIPVVALSAWLLNRWAGGAGPVGAEATLLVRAGLAADPNTVLAAVFAKHLHAHRLVSAATVRQGAAIELTYAVRLKPGASAVTLVADLNKTEGVQGVEWKDQAGT